MGTDIPIENEYFIRSYPVITIKPEHLHGLNKLSQALTGICEKSMPGCYVHGVKYTDKNTNSGIQIIDGQIKQYDDIMISGEDGEEEYYLQAPSHQHLNISEIKAVATVTHEGEEKTIEFFLTVNVSEDKEATDINSNKKRHDVYIYSNHINVKTSETEYHQFHIGYAIYKMAETSYFRRIFHPSSYSLLEFNVPVLNRITFLSANGVIDFKKEQSTILKQNLADTDKRKGIKFYFKPGEALFTAGSFFSTSSFLVKRSDYNAILGEKHAKPFPIKLWHHPFPSGSIYSNRNDHMVIYEKNAPMLRAVFSHIFIHERKNFPLKMPEVISYDTNMFKKHKGTIPLIPSIPCNIYLCE